MCEFLNSFLRRQILQIITIRTYLSLTATIQAGPRTRLPGTSILIMLTNTKQFRPLAPFSVRSLHGLRLCGNRRAQLMSFFQGSALYLHDTVGSPKKRCPFRRPRRRSVRCDAEVTGAHSFPPRMPKLSATPHGDTPGTADATGMSKSARAIDLLTTRPVFVQSDSGLATLAGSGYQPSSARRRASAATAFRPDFY